MNTENPTNALYETLLAAYNFFNGELFSEELPALIMTVQRSQKAMGYFAPNRWATTGGATCHELSINPTYLANTAVIDVFQTLVHEMVHCWQECFGKPTRSGYHNKEFAEKMIEVGLMPSTTGLPGGNATGQNMSDYPIAGGPFLKACDALLKQGQFELPWIDRFSKPSKSSTQVTATFLQNEELTEDDISDALLMPLTEFVPGAEIQEVKPEETNTKTKYTCPQCCCKVWGKEGLHLICEDCNKRFLQAPKQ